MKFVILIALCILSATASPIDDPQTVIVNGNDVPMAHTVTYHVHILLDSGSVTRVGSGIYIGTTWVLTVAQNLRTDLTALRCGFGNRDRNLLTFVNAENYFANPQFNSSNLDNNIGLIQLASNPTIIPTIAAIQMAVPATVQTAGTLGIIYGFGFTANGGNFATILQQAQKTIQADAACLATYPHLVGRFDTNFCALGAAGVNTPSMCGGDQGGPFVVNNVLVGLSSFIWSGDCFNGRAAAFTRVSAYRPWIAAVSGL